MHTAAHLLIKDTITYLKEQKKRSFFAKAEDLPVLQLSQIKKEEEQLSATSKNQRLSPPAAKPPLETKKSAPIQGKKEKPTPLPSEPQSRTALPKVVLSHPPTPSSLSSFEEMKRLLQAISPHFVLHSELPSDEVAKQNATGWVYKKQGAKITLLCGKEDLAKITLFKNIAKALNVRFSDARMIFASEIEKENGWDPFLSNTNLKLILTTDSSLGNFPKLMSHYRELPARKEYYLNKIPLILLPDLGLYLKKSSLKPALWKMLHQKIEELFETKS